jgi:hypothetical protein
VHGAADYADEWQALYRVEDARRRLKQAKADAVDARAAVLAWDAAATRDAVAAAVLRSGELARAEARRRRVEALRVAEAREAEVRRQRDAAGRRVRVLEARRKKAQARRQAVVSQEYWAAWVRQVRSQPRPLPGRVIDMGGPRDQWLSFELGDGKD